MRADGPLFNQDYRLCSKKRNLLVWTLLMLDVVLVQGTLKFDSYWLTCSVATGSKYQHKHEEETLLKEALGLPVEESRMATKGDQ
jgi:hypothetical protein